MMMSTGEERKQDAEWECISRAMSRIMEPPAGLEQRILAAVKRDAVEVKIKPKAGLEKHYLRWISGIAATLVIISGVALLNRHAELEKKSQELTETGNNRVTLADSEDYRLDKPFSGANEGGLLQRNAMPIRLATVENKFQQKGDSVSLPVEISSKVRHVWLVSDFGVANDLLQKICRINDKKIDKAEKNHDTMIYSVSLSDIELQNLVSLLPRERWALVSSEYPQPAEEGKVAFSGKKIDYEICLVRQ